jgi:DNA polymerase/3'-5' exonuclease PolX
MNNSNIIYEFQKLANFILFELSNSKSSKDKTRHMYRLKSVRRVINILKLIPFKIRSSLQLERFNGIGNHSLKRIQEILNIGFLHEVQQFHSTYPIILELQKVFGIGQKTAYNLITKYKVTSIHDLKQISDQLPSNIQKGLFYYSKMKGDIPRSTMDVIHKILKQYAKQIDKDLQLTLCGSYRRLKQVSNDIDILFVHPSDNNRYMHQFIDLLIKKQFIVDSFTKISIGTKYMGLCKVADDSYIRRIDIRFVPYKSYYYALLYFTGSKTFNQMIRKTAIRYGYKLNEYGLYKQNSFIPVSSEKEIFKLLNITYVSPKDR